MKRIVVVLVCLASSLEAVSLETFPFSITAKGLYIPTGRFFIGAGQALRGNTQAVAVAERSDQSFKGLTPEKVTLNTLEDQPNPLFGASINFLAMLERRPVVIPKSVPSSLFLIDASQQSIKVFQSEPLNDANGNPASTVLSLATSAERVLASLDAGASLAAFAAVPNRGGGFNGNGSGIALAFFRQVQGAQPGTKILAWDIVDAISGKKGNKAHPFGADTPELFITTPAANIASGVALHFDRELGLLYIGVSAQAGAGAGAGVRALVAASNSNGKISFRAIAPDSAFADAQSIIGSRGAGSKSSILTVRTMQTRTHLRYLIVLGGNGNDTAIEQSVFALPIVDNRASAAHGTLANVNSLPASLFGQQPPHRFLARVFTEQASKPDQLYKTDSLKARVGGMGFLPGPITDISVAGEAVFVSCTADAQFNQEQLAPGIFYSQPVFDSFGRISQWTDWQRVAGAAADVIGLEYDPFVGNFWYIPKNEQGVTNTVFRTQWSDGSDPLGQFIARQFPQNRSGVQGLFDFPYSTEGFSTVVDERLSVQIATGFNKVAIIQTGKQVAGLFSPFMDFSDPFISNDGTLRGFQGGSALSISGGVLSTIGPVTSAAVVSDGSNGWFVVAGSGGVAVLADAQGRGWPVPSGLGSEFTGLSGDFSWKLVSETRNIRKLISRSGNLYVLSSKLLERLTLTPDAIVGGKVEGVVLNALPTGAHDTQKYSFSDLYIKGPLAVLATNYGLFRSGNGSSIETAIDRAQVGWTLVTLPESAGSLTNPGPVSRLFAIRTSDLTSEDTLYVLNAYVGLSQALVYRFVIKLEDDQVVESSVKLFPDPILKGMDTFFANLGDYRNFLVTDGSLSAVSRSSFRGEVPILELLSPTLRSGESLGARARFPFLMFPSEAQLIGELVRSSASGTWMVPGDFGIRIQK